MQACVANNIRIHNIYQQLFISIFIHLHTYSLHSHIVYFIPETITAIGGFRRTYIVQLLCEAILSPIVRKHHFHKQKHFLTKLTLWYMLIFNIFKEIYLFTSLTRRVVLITFTCKIDMEIHCHVYSEMFYLWRTNHSSSLYSRLQ